jgi:hypothetical protein
MTGQEIDGGTDKNGARRSTSWAEFSILNAISQTVNQSIDLDEILNNSLDRIAKLAESVLRASSYSMKQHAEFAAQRVLPRPLPKA